MKVLDFFNLEDFKMSIPFTAIGARTCYSSKDLNYLLNDPRVVSREDRAKFLSKLGNYKHFSVFAHSFAYKEIGEMNALRIGATYFKSHYNPKYPDVIGVSLRHYLEDLLWTDEDAYQKAFDKMAEYDTPVEPLGKKENVTLIGILKEYDGYGVFYIDNVSRTMTHQLVRHTTLNFSQRSQRYASETDNYTIIPPSILENDKFINNQILIEDLKNIEKYLKDSLNLLEEAEIKEKAFEIIKNRVSNFKISGNQITAEDLIKITDEFSEMIYDILVHYFKIKREDARFVLPHGRKTTIVVSGTLSWLEDFITKRTEPHAQWEIRNVAQQMKELLQEQEVSVV